MTSLITETCLSLRPIGLSTALGQPFCPPGLLEQPGPRPGTASRPVSSMAGSAFADGSMMYRCRDWELEHLCPIARRKPGPFGGVDTADGCHRAGKARSKWRAVSG